MSDTSDKVWNNQNTRKTRILYIGGYSRSGSTLLLRLLAEQQGFAAVGELFDIWDRSYLQGQLCGCGKSFRECEFWIQVTVEAFGCKPADLDAEQLNKKRSDVQGRPKIPLLWRPALRPARYQHRLADYADTLQRIYQAVQHVTGAEFVVDSSKVPQYAWVLTEAPGVELHMIHLVRDSRATAFSWQRQRLRPEITSSETYMEKHSVLRSAFEWNLFNYMLRNRRKAFASYTLIRYEDLVAHPYRILDRVLEIVGTRASPATNDDATVFELKASHTASGNPGRFQTGKVSVTMDAEWMASMSLLRRTVVTCVTAIGLARFNYPLFGRRPAG